MMNRIGSDCWGAEEEEEEDEGLESDGAAALAAALVARWEDIRMMNK